MAARKYRKELLFLPIIGIQESLKFMTGRPGVRFQEAVGTLTGSAQFAPYKRDRGHNFEPNAKYRVLETFFGNVVEKFEPNTLVSTLLGRIGATKGDGQKNTEMARNVLALIAKSLSEHLDMELFSAERNANGDTTHDLFNGFDTITLKEITAGEISVANHNLIELDEEFTTANAVDLMKSILFRLNSKMRKKELFVYCSQNIVDKYNESYLATHSGLVYNTKYNQTVVEGSNGKLTFCPLVSKDGSEFIHITDKSNMLVGYDQMGDVESIEVERFEPFVLSYIATMFFGTEFEQIYPERMMVVKLAGSEETQGDNNQGGGDDNQGGGNDNQGGGDNNQGGGDNQGGNG